MLLHKKIILTLNTRTYLYKHETFYHYNNYNNKHDDDVDELIYFFETNFFPPIQIDNHYFSRGEKQTNKIN